MIINRHNVSLVSDENGTFQLKAENHISNKAELVNIEIMYGARPYHSQTLIALRVHHDEAELPNAGSFIDLLIEALQQAKKNKRGSRET